MPIATNRRQKNVFLHFSAPIPPPTYSCFALALIYQVLQDPGASLDTEAASHFDNFCLTVCETTPDNLLSAASRCHYLGLPLSWQAVGDVQGLVSVPHPLVKMSRSLCSSVGR